MAPSSICPSDIDDWVIPDGSDCSLTAICNEVIEPVNSMQNQIGDASKLKEIKNLKNSIKSTLSGNHHKYFTAKNWRKKTNEFGSKTARKGDIKTL